MSAVALKAIQSRTRAQALGRLAAFVLPWLLVALVFGGRFGGATWGLFALAIVVALGLAVQRWRALDPAAIARLLDARHPRLEDSSALLLQDEATLGALARLQRQRVAERLASLAPAPSLLPAFPVRAFIGNTLAGLLLAWLAHVLVLPRFDTPAAPPPAIAAAPVLPPGLRSARLRIQPPAYTGLPASEVAALGARVPEGAQLQWRLRMQGAPKSASLRFHDGTELVLARDGEDWIAARRVDRATLYRLRVDGRDSPWQRIGVLADRPPALRVLSPDRSLTLIEPGQARWALDLQASDDYGLGPAQLRITLAQGSGENIQVSAREVAIAGEGSARARRYRHVLELASLGFAAGDDLVVRLTVADNRRPSPQRTHSPSFILRWPPERGAEASGIEGMVQRTLPAYFRSQRQIIMDTEALLALRPRPPRDDFLARSDAIGVDQRILRLRYGQFLGEEAEEGRPGEDKHEAGGPPAREDAATALMEQYGHTHDIPEAATLLDPETRKLLKSALDAMWSAEGELRLGRPREALPHEYRALRFIKQVQQASRIYLARVGLEQAPVDMARRLGGERKGIAPALPRAREATADAPAPARTLWDALATGDHAAAASAADALEREVAAEPEAADSLALLAALDAWRVQPACEDCLARLRARLWPRLPKAPPAVAPREAGDARGRAYLEALAAPERTP